MSGASALQHHVELSEYAEIDDGHGGFDQGWLVKLSTRAEFIHLRGSETVMAGRLSGKHTQVIRIRSSSIARSITTDWKVKDTTTGTEFNIRDVTPTEDRRSIDLLCESGVAI